MRFLLVALCLVLSFSQKPPIKIACIGDCITDGTGLRDPEKYSYPGQLGYASGPGGSSEISA